MKKDTEEPPPVNVATPLKTPTSTPVKRLSVVDRLNTNIDSEDEFISIPRGRRRRAAAIVSDDESSRDSFVGSKPAAAAEEADDSQGSQDSVTLQVKTNAAHNKWLISHIQRITVLNLRSAPVWRESDISLPKVKFDFEEILHKMMVLCFVI